MSLQIPITFACDGCEAIDNRFATVGPPYRGETEASLWVEHYKIEYLSVMLPFDWSHEAMGVHFCSDCTKKRQAQQ